MQKAAPGRPDALPLSRRAKILPNLVLAALVGIILLLLGLWLWGFPPTSSNSLNQPSLHISNRGPFTIGSTIVLQGQHFSQYTIVALLLDGHPALDSNGQRLALTSDEHGSFSATLLISSAWGTGDHILSAIDTKSQQSAAVALQIVSSTTSGP